MASKIWRRETFIERFSPSLIRRCLFTYSVAPGSASFNAANKTSKSTPRREAHSWSTFKATIGADCLLKRIPCPEMYLEMKPAPPPGSFPSNSLEASFSVASVVLNSLAICSNRNLNGFRFLRNWIPVRKDKKRTLTPAIPTRWGGGGHIVPPPPPPGTLPQLL